MSLPIGYCQAGLGRGVKWRSRDVVKFKKPLRYTLQDISLPETLSTTQSVIDAHGVLAVPTESFYALACSAFDEQALQRVREIKHQPPGKPLLVLIGDVDQLSSLVSSIPPAAQILMDRFWPGPLTLIVPSQDMLSEKLTGGTSTVAVRLLGPGPVGMLLSRIGPVTGTSANRSGCPPPQTAQAVIDGLGNEVDILFDLGTAPGGSPSTIVDTREPIRCLREGPISFEEVLTALAQAGHAGTQGAGK